jgi:hypothetical protein
VGNGLLRMDSGLESRPLLPVQVTAKNNILATNTSSPLVSMMGSTSPSDLSSRLVWSGTNNYYEDFSVFWSIAPSIPTAMKEELDFDAWKSRWGADTEVDPNLDGIRWQMAWRSERKLSDLDLGRLRLDKSQRPSPDSWDATDSGDVGVDLKQLSLANDSKTTGSE